MEFQIALIAATLLCSLVAGLVFAFAVIVMPGIGTLDDPGFLRAFQVMDRIIQNNQPLFMIVWVGSVVAVVSAAALGFSRLEGVEYLILGVALAVYLFGVQLPTLAINIPLNNRIQSLDLETLDVASLESAREAFEQRWVRWNAIRTALALVSTVLLLVLLIRL